MKYLLPHPNSGPDPTKKSFIELKQKLIYVIKLEGFFDVGLLVKVYSKVISKAIVQIINIKEIVNHTVFVFVFSSYFTFFKIETKFKQNIMQNIGNK